jgi:general secretion pathway protein C
MIGKLLDRYMWAADLLIIALFASFLAAGVDHFATGVIDGLVMGAVRRSEEPAAAGRKPVVPVRKAEEFKAVDGIDILRRNIFDSVTGPLDGVQELPEDLFETPEEASDMSGDGILPLCAAPLKLLASYASPDHPEFSFVAIEREGQTSILQEGDVIQTYRVARITWRYAFLEPTSSGSTCYLDIWNEQLPSAPAAPAPSVGPLATGGEAADGKLGSAADFQAMLNKSIRDISPNEKDIDRSLIDFLVENKHMLMQSGRVLPNVEGDAINGFKVYGIRKTSLWGKLGIHNGDVILSVNGMPMDGPDKAYEAFAGLGGTSAMDVEVLRHGKPESFTYNIK